MKITLKRFTALLLALTVILSSSSAVFANTVTNQQKLDKLVELDVILGDSQGVNGEDTMTRYRSVVMMLRLEGLEDEMLAFDYAGKDTFHDAKENSTYVQRLLAYIKDNPELGVVGYPDGSFKPLQEITAREHAKMMLEVLGYEDGKDFTWATVAEKAQEIGLIPNQNAVADTVKFTVLALANMTYDALILNPKNVDITLGEVLGFVIKVTIKDIEVNSVKALNTKQIAVEFNKEVDKESAESASNYEVKDKGTDIVAATPSLSEDGKTVVLTLDGESKLTNASTAKVTVRKDVKDKALVALKADSVHSEVKVIDSKLPEVKNIEAVGSKTIKITFDEPVYDAKGDTRLSTNQVTVKSGIYSYIVTSLVANYAERSITATLGTNLIEGDIVVRINAAGMSDTNAIRDFAGLTALSGDHNFTYVRDTSVATATINSVNKATREITIKFSKPVYGSNVRVYHSVNGAAAYATAAVTKTEANASDTWVFKFTNELPSGDLTFFLVNDPNLANNQMTDLFGIKVPNSTLTYQVVADTIAPTVSEIKASTNDHFVVKFSEEIETKDVRANNFEILNEKGEKVTFSATLLDAKSVKLKPAVSLEDNANYTVTVKAMRDLAGNAMTSAYSQVITIGDNTNPSVANAYLINNDTIYVVFDEAMNSSDLANKANYLVQAASGGYLALGENDTVTVISPKKVKITWNANNLTSGVSDLTIGVIRDLAGKKLTSDTAFSTRVENILADTLTVEKAELTAKNKVLLTFSNELAAFDNTEFSIRQKDNDATDKVYTILQIESMTVNSDGKTEVSVILDNELNADATDKSPTPEKVEFLVGATANTKSVEGTVLTAAQEIDIEDKVAPSIKTVAFNSSTQMVVTFDEDLNPSTIASAGKNGFSVAGGTLNTAVKGSQDNQIILTGSNFSPDSNVSYTAGNITDVIGNALESVVISEQASELEARQNAVPNATVTLSISNFDETFTVGSVDLLDASGNAKAAQAIGEFEFVLAGTLDANSEANDQINVALANTGVLTVTITDDATTPDSLNGTVVMTISHPATGAVTTVTLTITGSTVVVSE